MKRCCSLLLSVILIFTCSITAFAEDDKYSTAGDLYQDWYDNLPDYICGVWSNDGGSNNLTFGIQNNEAGNAGKQEMLRLIKNENTVAFVYQTYSRNYLLGIQEELNVYFKKDIGLISTALDEKNNCIELGIHHQEKDEPATKEMIVELKNKYGDAVSVEFVEEIVPTSSADDRTLYYGSVVVGVLFLLGLSMLLLLKRRKT